MHLPPVMRSLAAVFQIPTATVFRPRPSTCYTAQRRVQLTTPFATAPAPRKAVVPFSTSAPHLARQKGKIKPDKRITLIRYHLHHPTTLTPRPLRFSRTRALRHWTIHRAWNLFHHNLKASRQLELERQWNSMREACEELRVGAGDGGRLFRRAMMKTGVWSIPQRGGGVPIEYSRGMVDWVGGAVAGAGKRRIWDSGWKRE